METPPGPSETPQVHLQTLCDSVMWDYLRVFREKLFLLQLIPRTESIFNSETYSIDARSVKPSSEDLEKQQQIREIIVKQFDAYIYSIIKQLSDPDYFVSEQSIRLPDEREKSRNIEILDDFIEQCQKYYQRVLKFRNILWVVLRMGQISLTDLSLRKIRALLMLFAHLDLINRVGDSQIRRWCVFGGFVRDLFSIEDFNDIDIWVDHKTGHLDICDQLRDHGYMIEITELRPKTNCYSLRAHHYKFTAISPDGERFPFDVSFGGSFHQMGLDYRCNSLYIEPLYSCDVQESHAEPFGPRKFTEFALDIRVYFPEFPMIHGKNYWRYFPRKDSSDDSRSDVMPYGHYDQISHYAMKHQYFPLDSNVSKEFPSYWERITGSVLCTGSGTIDKYHQAAINQMEKLFSEKKGIIPSQYPTWEEILTDIREKKLVPGTIGSRMLDEYREKHMQSKGYTL